MQGLTAAGTGEGVLFKSRIPLDWLWGGSGHQRKPTGLFHVSIVLCVCMYPGLGLLRSLDRDRPVAPPLPHWSPLRGLLVCSVEWKNPTPAHDSLGSPAQAMGLERNSHVFHCVKAGIHSDRTEEPGHPPLL